MKILIYVLTINLISGIVNKKSIDHEHKLEQTKEALFRKIFVLGRLKWMKQKQKGEANVCSRYKIFKSIQS